MCVPMMPKLQSLTPIVEPPPTPQCPNCGAPNPFLHPVCTFCGSNLTHEANHKD